MRCRQMADVAEPHRFSDADGIAIQLTDFTVEKGAVRTQSGVLLAPVLQYMPVPSHGWSASAGSTLFISRDALDALKSVSVRSRTTPCDRGLESLRKARHIIHLCIITNQQYTSASKDHTNKASRITPTCPAHSAQLVRALDRSA